MPNEVARLISKKFMPGFIEECFTFYYLMNGKHIGYLDLSIKTQSGKLISLFRKNGHQGPDWINAAVNIPEMKEPFFVCRLWKLINLQVNLSIEVIEK